MIPCSAKYPNRVNEQNLSMYIKVSIFHKLDKVLRVLIVLKQP